MVVIRGRFYARPFDSDRSISPIYCTISRTKDLRVHLSPCTPAQSAPTVDSQRCLSNTDCRRNEFRTEKDILLGQNVTLLEKFRSNRCFDYRCFQTWLQTIRSAHFHGISGLVSLSSFPEKGKSSMRQEGSKREQWPCPIDGRSAGSRKHFRSFCQKDYEFTNRVVAVSPNRICILTEGGFHGNGFRSTSFLQSFSLEFFF